MALITAIPSITGAYLPVNSDRGLANMLRTLVLTPVVDASAATYTWTTAPVVRVTHAAATCNITLPNETAAGLVAWPVGEARTLYKYNTSVNVIGITALTNVGYNMAAVNTAITTLIGSAVVPGIATGVPVWTIYRLSATAYLILQGA